MIGHFNASRRFWTCLGTVSKQEPIPDNHTPKGQSRLPGILSFQGKNTSTDLHNVLQSKDAQLNIATDGTNKNGLGGFGIIFYTNSNNSPEVILSGYGPVDGDSMDSTRAEIGGPLAALSTLHQVATNHNTKITCKITITLDNKHVANLARWWLGTCPAYNPSAKYQDLLLELNRLHNQIDSPPITIKWDKGHTEVANKNKKTWTTRQIFNDKADSLAKRIWTTDTSHPMYPQREDPLLPSTIWHILINNKRITNEAKTKVIDAIESEKFKERFEEKWPAASIDDFHWESMRQIMADLPPRQLTGHLKCIYSQWATLDVHAKRANSEKIPQRPFGCRCPDSNQHVIYCTRPSNAQLHATFIADLKKCLRKNSIPYDITKDLIDALTTLLKGESVENRRIGIATKVQERLGIEHIFRGRLALMWTERWIAEQEKNNRWHTDVSRLLIDWSRACWRLRCKELNRKFNMVRSSMTIIKSKAMFNLQQAYNLADRKLFLLNETQRLAKDDNTNNKWLNIVAASYTENRAKWTASKNCLARYFSIRYPKIQEVLFGVTEDVTSATSHHPLPTTNEIAHLCARKKRRHRLNPA